MALPTLDADEAIALAQQVDQAALDENGKPSKLPEAVKESLQDVADKRELLQKALGTAPAPEVEVAKVDGVIDALLRALYYNLEAWEILTDILPDADEAESLRSRIFGDAGLTIINFPAAVECSVVGTKLKRKPSCCA